MIKPMTELHCEEGIVELAHDDSRLYLFATNGSRETKLTPYEAYLLVSDIMVWLSRQNVADGMPK